MNELLLENNKGNLEEWLEDPANDIRYVLVNGKLQPNLQIEAGKIHRFRFKNFNFKALFVPIFYICFLLNNNDCHYFF